MSKTPQDRYLKDALLALIRLFGKDAVRNALDATGDRVTERGTSRTSDRRRRASVPVIVRSLRRTDPDRFALLHPFFLRVVAGELLRSTDDVRGFAELAGAKELVGAAHRELLVQLARKLAELDVDTLRDLLPRADAVSGAAHAEGYSLLTDRLMQKRP